MPSICVSWVAADEIWLKMLDKALADHYYFWSAAKGMFITTCADQIESNEQVCDEDTATPATCYQESLVSLWYFNPIHYVLWDQLLDNKF
jgi:hypothetical protein